MPRRHHGRYAGRRAARTMRRAGCCGLEMMSCCLVAAVAMAALLAMLVRLV